MIDTEDETRTTVKHTAIDEIDLEKSPYWAKYDVLHEGNVPALFKILFCRKLCVRIELIEIKLPTPVGVVRKTCTAETLFLTIHTNFFMHTSVYLD